MHSSAYQTGSVHLMRKAGAEDSLIGSPRDDAIDDGALLEHFCGENNWENCIDIDELSLILPTTHNVLEYSQVHNIMDPATGFPSLQEDESTSSSLEAPACNAEQELNLSEMPFDRMEAAPCWCRQHQSVPPLPPQDLQRPENVFPKYTAVKTSLAVPACVSPPTRGMEARFVEVPGLCVSPSLNEYELQRVTESETATSIVPRSETATTIDPRKSPVFVSPTTREASDDCIHHRNKHLNTHVIPTIPCFTASPQFPSLPLQVCATQRQPCRASARKQAHQNPQRQTTGCDHLPHPFSLSMTGTGAPVFGHSGKEECRYRDEGDNMKGAVRHEVFQSESFRRLPSPPPPPPPQMTPSRPLVLFGIATSENSDLLKKSSRELPPAQQEPTNRYAQDSSPSPSADSSFPFFSSTVGVAAAHSSSGIRKTHLINGKTVTEDDVLFGRGGKANNWPANVRLRELVRKHMKEYFSTFTSKTRKTELADSIVNEIRCRGRFLEERALARDFPSADKTVPMSVVCWVEVPWGRARKKVSQRFRQQRNESELPGCSSIEESALMHYNERTDSWFLDSLLPTTSNLQKA